MTAAATSSPRVAWGSRSGRDNSGKADSRLARWSADAGGGRDTRHPDPSRVARAGRAAGGRHERGDRRAARDQPRRGQVPHLDMLGKLGVEDRHALAAWRPGREGVWKRVRGLLAAPALPSLGRPLAGRGWGWRGRSQWLWWWSCSLLPKGEAETNRCPSGRTPPRRRPRHRPLPYRRRHQTRTQWLVERGKGARVRAPGVRRPSCAGERTEPGRATFPETEGTAL